MSPSFFIFSLPRSGSSWLSVFLTGRDSYCYHEPTADYMPLKWGEQIEKRKEAIIGAVDTGAYGYADKIFHAFPQTKFFTLYRDPLEVNRSCRWSGLEGFDAYGERDKLEALAAEPIFYSSLHDIEYLREVWARIIGTKFDYERTKQFMEMRIERDVQQFYSNRPDSHYQMQRLLA